MVNYKKLWPSFIFPDDLHMDADGSNQTRLTNNPAIDGTPAWSPRPWVLLWLDTLSKAPSSDAFLLACRLVQWHENSARYGYLSIEWPEVVSGRGKG